MAMTPCGKWHIHTTQQTGLLSRLESVSVRVPWSGKAGMSTLVVFQDDRPVWALGLESLSASRGVVHLALLGSEAECQECPQETLKQVAQWLDRHIGPKGPKLWQALLSKPGKPWAAWLQRWNFEPISEVQRWEAGTEAMTEFACANQQAVVSAQGFSWKELTRLFVQTCRQGLDFPELQGREDPEEVLRSYEASSPSGREFWYVLRLPGREPLGMLLLASHDFRPGGTWELMYVGVVVQERGKGWGRILVRHALAVARQHKAQRMVLAVDGRNQPAQKLYASVGFERTGSLRVFFRWGR